MINQAIAPFIAWLISQGIPCTGYKYITGNGHSDWPPVAIELTFDSSATKDQKDQAYELVNSFDYVPPVLEPEPDPAASRKTKAFLNDCVDDAKISPKWYGALGTLIDVSMDAPTRKKVWAQIKQDAEMAIPADAAAAIEAHAAAANMELK